MLQTMTVKKCVLTIDRIEGEIAVVEIGGRRVDVPVAGLPDGTREGDRFELVPVEAETQKDEEMDRLARLKSRTRQGPGNFDL
jgi:hypothetical protein